MVKDRLLIGPRLRQTDRSRILTVYSTVTAICIVCFRIKRNCVLPMGVGMSQSVVQSRQTRWRLVLCWVTIFLGISRCKNTTIPQIEILFLDTNLNVKGNLN